MLVIDITKCAQSYFNGATNAVVFEEGDNIEPDEIINFALHSGAIGADGTIAFTYEGDENAVTSVQSEKLSGMLPD